MTLLSKFGCIVLLISSCANNTPANAQYESIVKFKKNKPIQFPDFSLTFTGETYSTSHFDNGGSFTFRYFNFIVKSKKEQKAIRWSSGTGDIGPEQFIVDSKKFQIELRGWHKKNKWLKEDELVITEL